MLLLGVSNVPKPLKAIPPQYFVKGTFQVAARGSALVRNRYLAHFIRQTSYSRDLDSMIGVKTPTSYLINLRYQGPKLPIFTGNENQPIRRKSDDLEIEHTLIHNLKFNPT